MDKHQINRTQIIFACSLKHRHAFMTGRACYIHFILSPKARIIIHILSIIRTKAEKNPNCTIDGFQAYNIRL